MSAILPEWLPKDAWQGYVDMRKKLRKPMTQRAIELKFKALEAFKDNGDDIEQILDQSTQNSWTDLYPLKERRATPRQGFDNSRLGKHGQATANNAIDWLEGK